MKEFLKKYWVTIVVGLIGIAFSYYFYQLSEKNREPVFLIDPIKTKIIDSEKFEKTSLRISRYDGSDINGDISSIRFYFWNNGRESIKPSHVLESLYVALDDKDGEILDVAILKISRPVVNPRMSLDDTKRKLSFSFDILELNDGISTQIIYKGNTDVKFTISGTIEGVKKIKTGQYFKRKQFLKIFGKKFGLALSIVFIAGVFLSIVERYISKKYAERKVRIKMMITLLVILIFIMAMLTISIAKKKAIQNMVEVVPKEILTLSLKE